MIIGLSGKKRVGKDTIADHLVKRHGFIKYSFADPIKDIAKVLFSFSDEQLYGNDKEKLDERWNIIPRDFYQKFGTDYMQYIFPEHFPETEEVIPKKCFWIKRFIVWFEEQKKINEDVKVVITDVRFIHEYDFLMDNDAMIIRVSKNVQNTDTHISENELDDYDCNKFDYVISNNSNKELLYKSIDDIIDFEKI